MFIFTKVSVISLCFFPLFFQGEFDAALNLAEHLFISGNYDEAITEYKRFLFFNTEKEESLYANYKIGMAYRDLKLWQKSKEALQKSIEGEADEEKRDERRIDFAVVVMAEGSYPEAEFLFLKVEMFSRFPHLRKKAAFFRGLANIYNAKWMEAREAFEFYGSDRDEASRKKIQRISQITLLAQKANFRSPKLAKTLSTILPGSGQLYAGDWKGGANALFINLTLGYILANNLVDQDYKNFLFNSLFLFERFYSGNRHNAEEAAKKYNRRLNLIFQKEILGILGGDEDENP